MWPPGCRAVGTPVAIWICVGISFLSAVANVPLMWVDGCSAPKKPVPKERRPLLGEDEEVVNKILAGEFVETEILDGINEQRFLKGQPYLFVRPRPYEDEKDELESLRKRTKADFLYHQRKTRGYLQMLNDEQNDLAALCNQYNSSMRPTNEAEVESINSEVGRWFISYLKVKRVDSSPEKLALIQTCILFLEGQRLCPPHGLDADQGADHASVPTCVR